MFFLRKIQNKRVPAWLFLKIFTMMVREVRGGKQIDVNQFPSALDSKIKGNEQVYQDYRDLITYSQTWKHACYTMNLVMCVRVGLWILLYPQWSLAHSCQWHSLQSLTQITLSLCLLLIDKARKKNIPLVFDSWNWGPRGNWTPVAGFKLQSANHYTRLGSRLLLCSLDQETFNPSCLWLTLSTFLSPIITPRPSMW